MAAKITAHLIELTYDAAIKSYWRKKSLRQFLSRVGIPDNILATWTEDESKREFLDSLFKRLEKSDNGKAIIYKMALQLAEQITFPDLKGWEDSDIKIREASIAVQALKSLLRKQNEQIVSEREKEEVRRASQKASDAIKTHRQTKQSLSDELTRLGNSVGMQQGGYDFEDWFYRLVDFCEITCRRPYTTHGRQIDGSLTHEGTTYLIELKFTATQVGAPEIDVFRSKVESKADNTMGIMVSASGYSSVAVNAASGRKTPILLLDMQHLILFLSGHMNFSEIISRLRRHASQTAQSYLPVSEFYGAA
jgi:hypothetical protein